MRFRFLFCKNIDFQRIRLRLNAKLRFQIQLNMQFI
jgi:hypothetical protein